MFLGEGDQVLNLGLVAGSLAQVTPFWARGLLFNSWSKGSITAHGPEPLAGLHLESERQPAALRGEQRHPDVKAL